MIQLRTTIIRKTCMNPIGSRSKQSHALSRSLADMGNRADLGPLFEMISKLRGDLFGRSPEHSVLLNAEERDYVEQCLNVQLMRFLQGAGHIRNTNTGEVGIAFGTSYACVSVDSDTVEDPAELAPPVVFERDGKLLKVTLNVFAALRNGNYTTWAVTNSEPLSQYEGTVGFVSTYLPSEVAETEAVNGAAAEVQPA